MALGEEAALVIHAFGVLLGVLVFLARPAGALNRVLGALLVLRGFSRILSMLAGSAETAADARMYHAVANWYALPVPFLTFLLLHHLLPPRTRAKWRWWALAAAAAATLALAPAALHDATMVPGDSGGFHAESNGWNLALTLSVAAAQALAVAVAGHGAVTAWRGALHRRQAALVGLAYLYLVWGPLSRTAEDLLALDPARWSNPVGWVAYAMIPPVVWGALRLRQPFEGPLRRAFGALVAVPFVLAFAQHVFPPLGHDINLVSAGAYAVCISLAVVRYDLVGMGGAMQRRLGAAARAMLVFGLLLLPAGIVLVYVGASSTGLVVAAALGGGALALSPAPVRVMTRRVARIFAPDAGDPVVAAERARRYVDALHRDPLDEAALARLRDELGLRDADHRALARLVDRRDAPREPPVLGRYLVERELGRGSFGTALLAHDLATGRRVVLKRFHAAWGEKRALAEARALAQVRHPRVVPLLGIERAGDEAFLVLAYVEGGTLQDALDAAGPLAPERAARLALDVLEGLEAVHAAGLAHGDVKTANVLVDAQGRALVADLGAAQALARPEADLTLTVSPLVGSYATVAPEVLRGGRRTAAADVYATGAVLYKLLTGEDYVALAGRDVVSVTDAILHEPPRLPHPRVPPALEAVLRRALAKSPPERYADAGAMRAALAPSAQGILGGV